MFDAPPNQVPFDKFAIPIACDFTDGPPWAAGVHRDDGTIGLKPSICISIMQAINMQMRNRTSLEQAADAVMILSHEISHVIGSHDQNVTSTGEDSSEPDCVGWYLFPWVAKKLGIQRSTEARLSMIAYPRGFNACTKQNLQP